MKPWYAEMIRGQIEGFNAGDTRCNEGETNLAYLLIKLNTVWSEDVIPSVCPFSRSFCWEVSLFSPLSCSSFSVSRTVCSYTPGRAEGKSLQ